MSALAIGPFRGRFEMKLDPKGRLSLPPAYRQILPGTTPQLVVTNARYRGRSSLDVYSLGEWERLEKRISRLSSLRPEVQAFNRFYLSGGQLLDIDAQNRILVPQSLRRYANLETGAVLVGLGEKFEIWSAESWSTVYDQLTDSFEDTMSLVAALETHTDGEVE